MAYPSKKTNDLARAASALRKGLKVGLELLEDPDPQTRLRAIHATVQAASALAKLAELSDLEARLSSLEAALATKQPKSMRRVIL